MPDMLLLLLLLLPEKTVPAESRARISTFDARAADADLKGKEGAARAVLETDVVDLATWPSPEVGLLGLDDAIIDAAAPDSQGPGMLGS